MRSSMDEIGDSSVSWMWMSYVVLSISSVFQGKLVSLASYRCGLSDSHVDIHIKA